MKRRHRLSSLVVQLRNRFDMSQQRFAVEVVHCAIGSVARWETADVPLEALIALAGIAYKNGFLEIADRFRAAANQELDERIKEAIRRAKKL